MEMAEQCRQARNAAGIRLYVNQNNPQALDLYRSCGCEPSGGAWFMEK